MRRKAGFFIAVVCLVVIAGGILTKGYTQELLQNKRAIQAAVIFIVAIAGIISISLISALMGKRDRKSTRKLYK